MRIRLGVLGASGRMGRAVVRLSQELGTFELVAAVGASDIGKDVGELCGIGAIGVAVSESVQSFEKAQPNVVIDFSVPDATRALAEGAARIKAAIISGTTGLSEPCLSVLERAGALVPVFWEPNMSVGVFVLSQLLKEATEMLGDEYDIEIIEAHHNRKVDAPSGTANRLLEVARGARSGAPSVVFGRSGLPGARPHGEIGMHAIRGGDVIGDHTVHFLGQADRIELTHRASSRDLFARGALRAAAALAGKPPGRYSMKDVVESRK